MCCIIYCVCLSLYIYIHVVHTYIHIYIYTYTHIYISLSIYIERDIHIEDKFWGSVRRPSACTGKYTRQTSIHLHQSMFTVSNSKQVYCILNNWCVWINPSCGRPSCAPGKIHDMRLRMHGCFLFGGNPQRHTKSQTTIGKFRIRVLHRLTEGHKPTPAHYQDARYLLQFQQPTLQTDARHRLRGPRSNVRMVLLRISTIIGYYRIEQAIVGYNITIISTAYASNRCETSTTVQLHR